MFGGVWLFTFEGLIWIKCWGWCCTHTPTRLRFPSAVGVSQTSASTVGYRLKSRLTKEIDTEQKAQLQGYAPKAIHQIQSLAEKAESENVRLKANADLLDRAGWKPVDKQEITEANAYENMTDEELQKELDTLLTSQGYVKRWTAPIGWKRCGCNVW